MPQRNYPKYEPLSRGRDDRPRGAQNGDSRAPRRRERALSAEPAMISHEAGMVRLALNVGREHQIAPGDVVGVILGARENSEREHRSDPFAAEANACRCRGKSRGARFGKTQRHQIQGPQTRDPARGLSRARKKGDAEASPFSGESCDLSASRTGNACGRRAGRAFCALSCGGRASGSLLP